MTNQLKLLQNVLISSSGNTLQLADVWFSDKVEQINLNSKKKIAWDQISTRERWQQFKSEMTPMEQSSNAKKYDGNFLLLMPGAIDPHVHFNTPGFEFREDFEHGSLAAAYGGVTAVIDMPCTSLPPVTSLENLKIKLKAIEGRSWIDYAFWGGVSGSDLKKKWQSIPNLVNQLVDAGVAGFKSYFISGMDSFADLTYDEMLYIARWIQENDSLLAVHAEDKLWIKYKSQNFQDMWRNDWRAYCEARDDIAEARSIARLAKIARETSCKIHIVHLSSELGLEQVRKAQQQPLLLTAETCPHYLFFTQKDFKKFQISNYLKTAPPVKLEADKNALWEALRDGTIAFITTDHAGCDPVKEKSSWNFWDVYGGIPGVEHRVPFLFSEGFKTGRLDLSQTIDLLSTNIADFFSLSPRKGSLNNGADADFALINLWDSQVIHSQNMHSKGKYTPFEGIRFDAVVAATFLRGRLVVNQKGESEVKAGYGKPVFVSR